jgi:hypothetical protein
LPRVRLRSLLLVEERLLEAEYFLKRLRLQSEMHRFGFELNAFLSACRSVTYLLQKEMSGAPDFASWWARQQEKLKTDGAASFFAKLRNFSIHEGRVCLVGSARHRNGMLRWSYRFARGKEPVPTELLHRDVAECCRQHLAKLATIVLGCSEEFPFATCPKKALTPTGVRSLGITIEDVEETLGVPRGCTAVPASSDALRLKELRRHVDGVNFRVLRRLSRMPAVRVMDVVDAPGSRDFFGDVLTASIVEHLEAPQKPRS